jgi:hypothetical protein
MRVLNPVDSNVPTTVPFKNIATFLTQDSRPLLTFNNTIMLYISAIALMVLTTLGGKKDALIALVFL